MPKGSPPEALDVKASPAEKALSKPHGQRPTGSDHAIRPSFTLISRSDLRT
jgi:hypothetical protein